ncbi:alpha/beta hydrolase [Mycolicibacterium flavescens]|uniref:Alpha/beta hydrolase n=1 Tax=Mycolicibacterium flavescens TaxID=1776 RepID=A0A1E3RDG5_MYCFV|nr:alpha/beta hydrolase [Mycolicibacterium flavescens]MCV7282391.1 alpha/beta hydrolase [Mycolicibacterium flavescens]ODQ87915.1 alpha/beta hydrolase [Mycolicibacterium flavescens]
MRRADVTVDVTEACALDCPLSIAATAYLPAPERLRPRQPVVFALPGGGYSRGYYDMHFDGHDGYSQAAHHVERGLIMVAIDHLGAGDSTAEVADTVRIEDIAAADDAAVQEISRRLRDGTLVEGYPAVDVGARIGMGQSMGGGVTVIMAARHRTYDAVAVLGYSGIHTVLPQRSAEDAQYVESFHYTRDDGPDSLSLSASAAAIPEFLYPFHYEDVPADIVEADTAGGYPLRQTAPPFGSKSVPVCVVAMLSPGYISAEAAELSVPVFIGLGERDTAPEPHREPSAYRASTDITLFVCERMAHMHNFASTRKKLWDRLVTWFAAVSDAGVDASSPQAGPAVQR